MPAPGGGGPRAWPRSRSSGEGASAYSLACWHAHASRGAPCTGGGGGLATAASVMMGLPSQGRCGADATACTAQRCLHCRSGSAVHAGGGPEGRRARQRWRPTPATLLLLLLSSLLLPGIASCASPPPETDGRDDEAGRLSDSECPGYLPPGTSVTGGASNMVLAYMDYRSELGYAGHPPCDCPGLHYPTMVWNASNFSSMLRYSGADDVAPRVRVCHTFPLPVISAYKTAQSMWRSGIRWRRFL